MVRVCTKSHSTDVRLRAAEPSGALRRCVQRDAAPCRSAGQHDRFVHKHQKADIDSLNRSPHFRTLGDYSREDEKGCNAFPARRCSAPPIRQKRSAQSAIRWSAMRFSWHYFWAYSKQHKQTHTFPNIPFEGRFVVKKIVIQKSQNRPYATPNPK